ncbi:MAG: hypothetical protein LBR23_04375 [Spirochaetaceae bacterium]|jgi:hypothetical protein|nr:hypothetical protein [Spirochaetaceae bacterium]
MLDIVPFFWYNVKHFLRIYKKIKKFATSEYRTIPATVSRDHGLTRRKRTATATTAKKGRIAAFFFRRFAPPGWAIDFHRMALDGVNRSATG